MDLIFQLQLQLICSTKWSPIVYLERYVRFLFFLLSTYCGVQILHYWYYWICISISGQEESSKNWYLFFNPIRTEGRGCWYNVPQGYIFFENCWASNDFKLRFCDFWYFFKVNKVMKKVFRKNCQLSVMTVLSRASDDSFTCSFCVVNFIGNYVKISL